MISGGFGFNHVSGGGGTNLISFNRATDTYSATGGNDIARGTLGLLRTNTSNLAATVSNPPDGRTLAAALSANVSNVATGENSWGVATGTYAIPQTTPALALSADRYNPGAGRKDCHRVARHGDEHDGEPDHKLPDSRDRRLTGGVFTIGAATMSAAQTLTFTPAQFALSTFTGSADGRGRALHPRHHRIGVERLGRNCMSSSRVWARESLARADGDDSDDDATVITASSSSNDDAEAAGATIVALRYGSRGPVRRCRPRTSGTAPSASRPSIRRT